MGMNLGGLTVLLLIACLHQSTCTEAREANTRWTFKDNNQNTKSLPDVIQFDLETESGKISLNLNKQSKKSMARPLIMTSLDQKSIWKPSEEELMATYKDPAFDASATVVYKSVNGIKSAQYILTFTHENKFFSVGPTSAFVDNLSLVKDEESNSEEVENNNNNNNKNNANINIDGNPHLLLETSAASSLKVDIEKIKESRMRKRSDEEPRLMTIEVLTLIDTTVYNKFFNESNAKTDSEKKEDAMKNILYVYTHIMEGIRYSYESIDIEGLKFTIKWVGSLVAQKDSDFPVPITFVDTKVYPKIPPKTVDSLQLLHDMSAWRANRTERAKVPRHDFVLAFTKSDLYVPKSDTGLHGHAFRNAMCSRWSVGISQHLQFFQTIKIAAHEMGHNLGAFHDGDTNNCSGNDHFIMGGETILNEKTFYNTHLFSSCSKTYFEGRIKYLDKNKENCLTDGGDNFKSREKDIFLRLYPGQLYDLHDQCKMVFGPESYYCGGLENDKRICREINCYDIKRSTCRNFNLLTALDGTSCANGAWCFRKNCVSDKRAPRSPDSCQNGDQHFPSTAKHTCKHVIENPSQCKKIGNMHSCCASCSGERVQNITCQDTIDECPTLEPKDCYNKYYATTCCETCKNLVQNPSDSNCLYGDKDANCWGLVPEVCYLKTNYCCQSCSKYFS